MNALTVNCQCGTAGRAFSFCKKCGGFLSATLARQFFVEKMRDGPKAGQWALVAPNGDVRDYYSRKRAAYIDCEVLNDGLWPNARAKNAVAKARGRHER